MVSDGVQGGSEVMKDLVSLVEQIRDLLNQYSRENKSNTPDFILANYLLSCLETGEKLINAREDWYGVKLSIGINGIRVEKMPEQGLA